MRLVFSRTLRVLFWSDLYWPYIGGAEVFAARLMASLRPRGVEFLVVTSHHDRELPDAAVYEGIAIRRLPFRAAIEGRDVKAFVRAIGETTAIKHEFGPDLIHMNAIGPSAIFHLRTQAASTAPLVVTLQQEVLATQSGAAGTVLSQILDSAAHVVGCSIPVLDQVRATQPQVSARSSCIYNGLDAPPLAPAPLPSTPHLVCVGRLVPAKGFDVAIRAFAHLASRYPHAQFTIAGDGVMRDELVALAASLSVADRVTFRGWVDPDDVPGLLNEATAVVMPSRREGMPMVAVQAAWMARPLIATSAGGLAEIVVDGRTGLIVPPEDPEAIAAAASRLIEDRGLAGRLGSSARQHVAALLDWDAIASSYHRLYTTLEKASHAQDY